MSEANWVWVVMTPHGMRATAGEGEVGETAEAAPSHRSLPLSLRKTLPPESSTRILSARALGANPAASPSERSQTISGVSEPPSSGISAPPQSGIVAKSSEVSAPEEEKGKAARRKRQWWRAFSQTG